MASEGSIYEREELGVEPSPCRVRAILPKEESFASSMDAIPYGDVLLQQGHRVSDLLSRKEDVGSTKERVSFVVWKMVTGIARREMEGGAFDNLPPINVLLGL
jgi:hypothetical protein